MFLFPSTSVCRFYRINRYFWLQAWHFLYDRNENKLLLYFKEDANFIYLNFNSINISVYFLILFPSSVCCVFEVKWLAGVSMRWYLLCLRTRWSEAQHRGIMGRPEWNAQDLGMGAGEEGPMSSTAGVQTFWAFWLVKGPCSCRFLIGQKSMVS